MSKRIVVVASIFFAMTLLLVIYPSLDRPIGAEQSKYTGNEDHSISLPEAANLTKAYRIASASDVVLGHYFGKNAIEKALAQPGCVGIRMYYGKHKDGSPAMVIVGVDNKGNDITSGLICQKSVPCPPDCPVNSELKQANSFATLK